MLTKPNFQQFFPFVLFSIIQLGFLVFLIAIKQGNGFALIIPMICFWLASVWGLNIRFWSVTNIAQFSITLIGWVFTIIIIALGYVIFPEMFLFVKTEWAGFLVAAFLGARFFHWQWGDRLDKEINPEKNLFSIYPVISVLAGLVLAAVLDSFFDKLTWIDNDRFMGIATKWFLIPAVFWQMTLGYMLATSDNSQKFENKIREIGNSA